MRRVFLGGGILLAAILLVGGCQTWVPVPGLTLPDARYLEHPPTYTPESGPFPLPREMASMQEGAEPPASGTIGALAGGRGAEVTGAAEGAVSKPDHKLADELVKILNETQSTDTFFVTSQCLVHTKADPAVAVPIIICNAERLGVLKGWFDDAAPTKEQKMLDKVFKHFLASSKGVRKTVKKSKPPLSCICPCERSHAPEGTHRIQSEPSSVPTSAPLSHGSVLNQTVWNSHFEAGTDRLAAAGLEHLAYLARRPHSDPTIYLQSAKDILSDSSDPDKTASDREELDCKRKAAILNYLSAQTAGRAIDFQVFVYDPADPKPQAEGESKRFKKKTSSRSPCGSMKQLRGYTAAPKGTAGTCDHLPEHPTPPLMEPPVKVPPLTLPSPKYLEHPPGYSPESPPLPLPKSSEPAKPTGDSRSGFFR
jgi:hypothetical protein